MSASVSAADLDVLRVAEPLLDVLGLRDRWANTDSVLAHDILVRGVVGMVGRRFTMRWVRGYAPEGCVVHTAPLRLAGDRCSARGVSYPAAAIVLMASRHEEGVWDLTPGVAGPAAAASAVLLSLGWAEVLR